jgi:hypothetical protein
MLVIITREYLGFTCGLIVYRINCYKLAVEKDYDSIFTTIMTNNIYYSNQATPPHERLLICKDMCFPFFSAWLITERLVKHFGSF